MAVQVLSYVGLKNDRDIFKASHRSKGDNWQ